MMNYKAPTQDVLFLFKHVFKLEAFWASLDGLDSIDQDTVTAILSEAAKLCEEVVAPLNRESDEQGCQWNEGQVLTPAGYKEAYTLYSEGGWGGLGGDSKYGGMGMPKTLVAAVEEMLQGACMAFGLAPMLTAGACLALNAHGSERLKALYLPKMYTGEWSGAMDLTEPHCGTDLGLIRTKALPNDDGSYLITGTKIFITWGEHDMADNIVHLVLAKLPDALPGSKGISMFLVPKILVKDDGSLGEPNPVHCGSLEKKMGIKASATCVMNFDGAKGWLVGEPNEGLSNMFTMMNYERLTVGIQAIGASEASYYNACAYAKDRLQSRSATGKKRPDKMADPIIYHADVRRMLMDMRAYNEGSRAFYLYVAKWLDLAKFSSSDAEKEKANDLIALLTPVAKAFISDVSLQAAIAGQQVLGGHGYVREWGQEQYVRDIRITQIYEGTNGIQAMDLMGRKTVACQAALFERLRVEIQSQIDTVAQHSDFAFEINALTQALADLGRTTDAVVALAAENPDAVGAAAVDYLHFMGHVIYGFLWLRMMNVAPLADDEPFSIAKINTGRYYFAKLLPNYKTLMSKIMSGPDTTMSLEIDML